MIIYFMLNLVQMQKPPKFNKLNLIQLLLVLAVSVHVQLNFIGKFLIIKKKREGKRVIYKIDIYSFLLASVNGYAGDQITMNQLPENKAIQSIAHGLATAWKHYGNPK